jgi:nucleoside 2-deoxyribosyltransferase
MPFRKDFSDIYKLGIKGACEEAGCVCERVDEQYVDGNKIILHQVFEQIEKADIIIADLSGLNPNVFYEVGYAHAYKKEMILLTQNEEEIPFDLQSYRYETYSLNNISELKEELIKKVKWILSKKKNEKKSSEPQSVRTNRKIKKIRDNIPQALPRLKTGQDLLEISEGAHTLSYGHDELNLEETNLVGEFLDTLRDGVDLIPASDPSFRIKLTFDLTNYIKELELLDLFIFGAKEKQQMEVNDDGEDFYCTHIGIYRKNGDNVFRMTPSKKS